MNAQTDDTARLVNGTDPELIKGDRSSAKVVAKTGVKMGTDAPVGNLFSDGNQIWVHGGTRLYALWPDDSKDDEKPDSEDDKKSNDDKAGKNSSAKSKSSSEQDDR